MLVIISFILFIFLAIVRIVFLKKIEHRLDVIFTSLILSIVGVLLIIFDIILNQHWMMILPLIYFGDSTLIFSGGFIIEKDNLKKEKI